MFPNNGLIYFPEVTAYHYKVGNPWTSFFELFNNVIFEHLFELVVDSFNLAERYTSKRLANWFKVGVNGNFVLKIGYLPIP